MEVVRNQKIKETKTVFKKIHSVKSKYVDNRSNTVEYELISIFNQQLSSTLFGD